MRVGAPEFVPGQFSTLPSNQTQNSQDVVTGNTNVTQSSQEKISNTNNNTNNKNNRKKKKKKSSGSRSQKVQHPSDSISIGDTLNVVDVAADVTGQEESKRRKRRGRGRGKGKSKKKEENIINFNTDETIALSHQHKQQHQHEHHANTTNNGKSNNGPNNGRQRRRGRHKSNKNGKSNQFLEKERLENHNNDLHKRRNRQKKNDYSNNRYYGQGHGYDPHYEHSYNDKNDTSQLEINEEAFPTLHSEQKKESENKNKDLGTGSGMGTRNGGDNDGGDRWSNIAHMGHKHSVQQQAEFQKKRERLQHELDTYTRMEILRPDDDHENDYNNSKNNNNNDDDDKNKATDKRVIDEKDDNQKDNKNDNDKESKSKYNFGWTIKLLKADKLKERWLRALKDKQIKEDQERVHKMKKIDNSKSKNIIHALDEFDYVSIISLGEISASTNESSSSYSIIDHQSDSDESSISSDSSSSSLLEYLERPFPLHFAIIQNDETAVRDLLSLPPNLTSRDKQVQIKVLLEMANGKSALLPPNIDEEKSLSILHFAILLHRSNILKVLLSSGRKYNLEYVTSTLSIDDIKNDLRCSALMMACKFDLEGCVKVLMSYGPRLNIRHPRSGECALHIACRYAEPSTVKLLLSSSRSNAGNKQRLLCRRNNKGETPLHLCCTLGRLDMVEVLLNSCSAACTAKVLEVPDNRGYIPLLSAIETSNTELVLHLLSWRGNIRGSQSLSKQCLIVAVATKSFEMVSLLIECLDSTACSYDFSVGLCETLTSFDDSSTEGMDIVRLLIDAGANPFDSCTRMMMESDGERTHICSNPLSIAVYKGQVNFVVCMLDSFFTVQKRNQKERRMDRILQRRPESYFCVKEKIESDHCQQSGQEALVTALLLCHESDLSTESNNLLSTRRLGCCLAILRRGVYMTESSLAQLLKGIKSSYESHLEMMLIDNLRFKASYTHQVLQSKNLSKRRKRDPYGRSYADDWNKILLSMDWMWANVTDGEITCTWIQSQRKMIPSVPCQKHDECYLVLGEKRLLAHKSILESKSSKLEAAIRFAEMNEEEKNVERTEILLDVSFDSMKLFVQHCYHGSIIFGLSPNQAVCCQQLLELYALGQEYLCPSLSLECEMRLLASDPYRCVCPQCCDKIEVDEEGLTPLIVCHYCTKGPSKLMTAENLLGIIAELEELNQLENCYHINVNAMDVYCRPLETIWSIAWMSTILNFADVLKSDSYLSVFHSTMREYTDRETPEQLECFGDEIGVLLLKNCMDALCAER
jgi:ankyrin repeat protein